MQSAKLFSRYALVGVANTLIHWCVFYIMLAFFNFSQAFSNFFAFILAVTFSFFANAKWTFDAQTTTLKYIIFVLFMGGLSWLVGRWADVSQMPPIVTLIAFSALSLVLGFFYSKKIVFRKDCS